MGNASIIIGITAVTIIVSYLMFKINQTGTSGDGSEAGDTTRKTDNHALLQVFMFFFIIFNVFLIGKVTLDDKDFCAWNVANSTTNGSVVSYGYDYQCETNSHNTANTFYYTLTGLVSFVGLYIFLFYSYRLFNWIKDSLGLK